MATTTTTFRGYVKPDLGYTGTPDWGTIFNDNAAMIDTDIGEGYTPVGPEADLPASPSVGDTYIASDTGVFYKCLTDGVWTGTIAASEIPAGAIDASKLGSGVVTAVKIAAGAVGASHIAAGAVTTDHIATGAVGSSHIAAGAVTADKIAVGAVTADKITAGAVTTAKLADGAATVEKLAAGAVRNVGVAEITSQYDTTSTTFVDVPGLSVTLATDGGPVVLILTHQGTVASGVTNATAQLTFAVDGTPVGGNDGLQSCILGGIYAMIWHVTPAAGSHTFTVQIRASVTGATASINVPYSATVSNSAKLIAMEVRK